MVYEGLSVFSQVTDTRLVDQPGPLEVRVKGLGVFSSITILPKLATDAKEAARKYGLIQRGTISDTRRGTY